MAHESGVMRLEVLESVDAVSASQWNRLNRSNDPFLQHEFLAALEHNQCVGDRYGWWPRHLAVWNDDRLAAVVPLYEKNNSYGEFVFDFAWADAYRRQGIEYYPKLVSAIPYTPATGNRVLIEEGADRGRVFRAVTGRVVDLAREIGASSVHWLFLTGPDNDSLAAQGFMERVGCQFHWTNPGYAGFEDFLSVLSSKRRKNIRRERRLVRDAGLRLELLHGPEITDRQWELFTGFYEKTFHERTSLATLNQGFFEEVGQTLGPRTILVLAHHGDSCVAGALFFRSDSTLYGRHWGCGREYDGLHFEVCYYQGIDYCIREGLRRFEPGAQGEHKIWRGFLPTLTYSRHWVAHPGFRSAVEVFLRREKPAILGYAETLMGNSPFRHETA